MLFRSQRLSLDPAWNDNVCDGSMPGERRVLFRSQRLSSDPAWNDNDCDGSMADRAHSRATAAGPVRSDPYAPPGPRRAVRAHLTGRVTADYHRAGMRVS